MQYLKEEIRNRIMSAALDEFMSKGYEGSSMRDIASEAGVAIGNVYRYFKNKDELFNSIMEPVYRELATLIGTLYSSRDFTTGIQKIVTDITGKTMDIFARHSSELIILINKSSGSRFQNIKSDLISLVEARIKTEMVPVFTKSKIMIGDDFFYRIMAETFINGIFLIFDKYRDIEKITMLLNNFLLFCFEDIAGRFA